MAEGFTGRCLCGAVSYVCDVDAHLTGHCHCVDCRRSSGTGHSTHMVVPRAALAVRGRLTFYDSPADSGNVVSRGFCPRCGSAIYSTNAGMPETAFVRASSLDDPEVARPGMTVYASRAVSWDPVDPALTAFPEMPPRGPGGSDEETRTG